MNPYIYSKKVLKKYRPIFISAASTYGYGFYQKSKLNSYGCSYPLLLSLGCIIPNIIFGLSLSYSMGVCLVMGSLYNLCIVFMNNSKYVECEKSFYKISNAIHSTGNMELILQLYKSNPFYEKWDFLAKRRIINMCHNSIFFSIVTIGWNLMFFLENIYIGYFSLLFFSGIIFLHRSRCIDVYPSSDEIFFYKSFLEKIYFLEESLGENIFNHHIQLDHNDK